MDAYHEPVMTSLVIELLNVRRGGKYIDATIGGGGHAKEIIERGGVVLGIDQDKDAIEHVRANSQELIAKSQLTLVHGNFADIKKIAWENGFEKVDGVLLDLGLSSYQIEQSGRGFSFNRDEPLDMRMNTENHLTADEIINKWNEQELYELFSRMGEEPNSRALAQDIVRARRVKPIKTTGELTKIIEETVRRRGKTHPGTRVFQALRIAVNAELENLRKGLRSAFELLQNEGRIAVISFHSLEDRIVKLYFLGLVESGGGRIISKKPITATPDELRRNRRARSAKLRVIERIGNSK